MSTIFDRNRLRLHRDRFAGRIRDHAFLIELSGEDIVGRLEALGFESGDMLEIGARTGIVTELLTQGYPKSTITVTDISEEMLRLNPAENKIIIDEEHIGNLGDINFDAIVSVLNLHHLNDIKQFFIEIKRLLKADGIFIASMIGAGSLSSLRRFFVDCEIEAAAGHMPHVYPFAQASDIYRLLQAAGFKFIITDTHRVDLEYDNPMTLMRELQAMGESSCLVNGANILARSLIEKSLSGTFVDHIEIVTLTAKR